MLRNKFAQTGSPSSGRGQIAGGRYLEGLAAGQLDRTDQMLMGAVNQRGQLPVTQEPQYINASGQLTQGIAQAVKADKQDKANRGFDWGGLFGGIVGLGADAFLPGSGSLIRGLSSLTRESGGGGSGGGNWEDYGSWPEY